MKTPFNKLTVEKQIRAIHKALEKDVTPMLMSHGGGLEVMDIDGWKISIKYYGACHGCPLADSGTLGFIEQSLQDRIDKKIKVVSA